MFSNWRFIVFCFCLLSCGPSKVDSARENILSASELKPYGRYTLNDRQQLELISSGVHFGFTFRGTQCKLYASNFYAGGHNYIQYTLDGVY
jgi:hypothetical protein